MTYEEALEIRRTKGGRPTKEVAAVIAKEEKRRARLKRLKEKMEAGATGNAFLDLDDPRRLKSYEAIKAAKEKKKQEQQLTEEDLRGLMVVGKDESGRVIMQEKQLVFLEKFIEHKGNLTKAAASAFNIENRAVAALTGRQYFDKLKDAGMIALESRDITYGKMLEVAIEKMMESKDPAWWDRLMKIARFEDFMGGSSKKDSPSVVNIVQSEKSVLAKYIDGEVVSAGDEEQPSR